MLPFGEYEVSFREMEGREVYFRGFIVEFGFSIISLLIFSLYAIIRLPTLLVVTLLKGFVSLYRCNGLQIAIRHKKREPLKRLPY